MSLDWLESGTTINRGNQISCLDFSSSRLLVRRSLTLVSIGLHFSLHNQSTTPKNRHSVRMPAASKWKTNEWWDRVCFNTDNADNGKVFLLLGCYLFIFFFILGFPFSISKLITHRKWRQTMKEKIPWKREFTVRSDPWAGLIASCGSFYPMVRQLTAI